MKKKSEQKVGWLFLKLAIDADVLNAPNKFTAVKFFLMFTMFIV